MLIAIAAIAVVWASVLALVWAACAAASRADTAGLAADLVPGLNAYGSRRSGPELTVWDNLPGLPVGDTKLRAYGAR
jgi:hypothetical protein